MRTCICLASKYYTYIKPTYTSNIYTILSKCNIVIDTWTEYELNFFAKSNVYLKTYKYGDKINLYEMKVEIFEHDTKYYFSNKILA